MTKYDPGMMANFIIHDSDGALVYEIVSLSIETVAITDRGQVNMKLLYSDARALHRALGEMLSEVDLARGHEADG